MTRAAKDLTATGLVALVVLTYAATHESWNVWLIGSSHRWAAGAILLLGGLACGMGDAGEDTRGGRRMTTTAKFFASLGVLSLVFGAWALASGSLTPLSLLVACTVLLWAASTARHVAAPLHPHVPT